MADAPSTSLHDPTGSRLSDADWLAWARRAASPAPLGALGPYELIEEIGRGSQGTVFRARQPGTRRDVVIKRLAAGSFATPRMRARFEREIEALGSLRHPNIVAVHAADAVDQQPILVMEWIDGRPIDLWAAGRAPRDILAVFTRVCDAVHHAHQRGVIHRDLKPSNILVDASGEPRVLDFGLARLASGAPPTPPTHTSADGFLGTPAYAPPEQIDGPSSDVDARSDLYSLGVVLYELLTGAWPFAAPGQSRPDPSLPAVFDAIRRVEPRRPSGVRPELGRELDAILLKAIARDPAERYASADAFTSDLRRFLAGQTVLAHPPTTLYQLHKLLRRHRLAVAVGAAIAALVLTGAVVSTALAVKLARQRDDLVASQQRERREAEKVLAANAFLKEMLLTNDPIAKLRPDIGLREVLAEAGRSLNAGALADQPDVEASVRATIGQVYTRLQLPWEGEPHLRRALQILSAQPEQTLELADAMAHLAICLSEGRKLEEGVALHRSALALRRALAPSDRQTLMRRLWSISTALRDADIEAEAESTAREALAISQQLHGDHHADTAESRYRLGVVLVMGGQAETAAAELRTALELQRELLGPRHPACGSTLARLGRALSMLPRPATAEAPLHEGVSILTESLGPNHPITLRARMDVVRFLRRQQRFDESDRLCTELLPLYTKYYGEHSYNVGYFKAEWARVVAPIDPPRAESLARDSLAALSRVMGPNDAMTQTPRLALMDLLVRRAAYAEAEHLLRAAQAAADITQSPATLRQRLANTGVRLYRAWNAAEPSEERAADLREWQSKLSRLREAASSASDEP